MNHSSIFWPCDLCTGKVHSLDPRYTFLQEPTRFQQRIWPVGLRSSSELPSETATSRFSGNSAGSLNEYSLNPGIPETSWRPSTSSSNGIAGTTLAVSVVVNLSRRSRSIGQQWSNLAIAMGEGRWGASSSRRPKLLKNTWLWRSLWSLFSMKPMCSIRKFSFTFNTFAPLKFRTNCQKITHNLSSHNWPSPYCTTSSTKCKSTWSMSGVWD